jgi:deoxyribodipyrimidine photo-lyase
VQDFIVWWMKRDLRLLDNAALSAALSEAQERKIPLAAVWLTEPESLAADEYHPRRERFVLESLSDLQPQLRALGIPLVLAEGSATDVFEDLARQGLKLVFSHEETGVLWTYRRDLALKELFAKRGIIWTETPTNGVVRGLKDRGRWQGHFQRRMGQKPLGKPEFLLSEKIEFPDFLEHAANTKVRYLTWSNRNDSLLAREAARMQGQQQKGGESVAIKLLERFLSPEIHKYYVSSLSKPGEAQHYSSRLSPYLTFGCLSSRQIISMLSSAENPLESRSISAFRSRLAWRCHFVQKLENFPDMENREQNAALTGIRPEMTRGEYERWLSGETGYPLIDACLRSVHKTGFLNFRMRAMLMSFATHLMWRDWRTPAWDLARAFLDFEAGIHFSQVQMQSAVTGNNQIRIYNPLKQSEENDANASFIKKWVPELREVSPSDIHAMKNLPSTYAGPIVDLKQSMAFARAQLFSLIKQADVRSEAKQVQEKLGSRGGPLSWRGKNKKKQNEPPRPRAQTLFDDE